MADRTWLCLCNTRYCVVVEDNFLLICDDYKLLGHRCYQALTSIWWNSKRISKIYWFNEDQWHRCNAWCGLFYLSCNECQKETYCKFNITRLICKIAVHWATQCWTIYLTHKGEPHHSSNGEISNELTGCNIERVRFNNTITPKNQRICTRCELKEIDDEIHLLLHCSAMNNEREILFNSVAAIINIQPINEMFLRIMTSTNITVVKSLAQFIYGCFKQIKG